MRLPPGLWYDCLVVDDYQQTNSEVNTNASDRVDSKSRTRSRTRSSISESQWEPNTRWVENWALLSIFLLQGLVLSSSDLSGTLFPAVRTYFTSQGSSGYKEAAALFSFQIGWQFLLCPFSSYLVSRLGTQHTALLGSMLAFYGYFIGSFSTRLGTFIITLSLTVGTGMSMILMANTILLSRFFEEDRVIVYGVVGMSNGLFNLVTPHLVHWLERNLGLFHTLRCLAILFYWLTALCLIMPTPISAKPRTSTIERRRRMSRAFTASESYGLDGNGFISVDEIRTATDKELLDKIKRLRWPSRWQLGCSPMDIDAITRDTDYNEVGPNCWTGQRQKVKSSSSSANLGGNELVRRQFSSSRVRPNRTSIFLPKNKISSINQASSANRSTTISQAMSQEQESTNQSNLSRLTNNKNAKQLRNLVPSHESPSSLGQRPSTGSVNASFGSNDNLNDVIEQLSVHWGPIHQSFSFEESLPTTDSTDNKQASTSGIRASPRSPNGTTQIKSSTRKSSITQSITPDALLPLVNSRPYLILLLAMAVAMFGYSIPNVHLVEYCNKVFPSSNGNHLISALGLSAAFGPIGLSLLRGTRWLRRFHTLRLFHASLICYALSALLLPLAQSFLQLLFTCVLVGLFEGIINGLVTPLCLELTGQEAVGLAVGIYYAVCALPTVLAAPIGALMVTVLDRVEGRGEGPDHENVLRNPSLLYESYSNYAVSFCFCGFAFMFGGIILFFAKPEREYQNRITVSNYEHSNE